MSVSEPSRPSSPRPSPSGRADVPAGRRRGRWALLAVVLVALAVVAWIIFHSRSPSTGAAGGAGGRRGGGGVNSVDAARAGTGDVPIYLDALGTVTPPATVTVRAQIAGQLFGVDFREGQMVTKGQRLAQVDPRPYEAALAQAAGALARDQALLTNAKLDLQRYQTLLSEDSIARQQVDTQAATVRQNEGTVALDKAAVQAARVNLGYTRITAPVSGRVGLRQVDPGNYVANGDANGIVTIAQITPIDVVFTLPEDNIPDVTRRMNAGARLVATAFDRAQTTALADGYLLTLDNQIDTTTGTVKAKARFANAGGALFPNQFVNLRLLVDTVRGAVIAPSSAVLRGQNGLFVWVVDADRTVHMRSVKIGPVVGENTSVTQGLQPGETVVTDGSDRLREGATVALPGDCPPAMGARGGRGAHGGASHAGNGAGARGAAGPAGGATGAPRCTPTASSQGQAAGAGRMQAMLANLGLDAAQQAKVKTIVAASQAQSAKLRDSGDFQGLRQIRQATNAQIEAVLRPDQKAKFEAARAQGPGGFAGVGGASGFGGAQSQEPASRGGGAPLGDLPPRAAATPAAGGRGALNGPAPAATAAEPGGGGGGGPRALLANLNLDAAQSARAQAIFAAAKEKAQTASASGDTQAARAARRNALDQLEAILRPDQKAKLAAERTRMRAGAAAGGGGF